MRGYYDVHPDKDSRLTLDPADEEPLGRSDAGRSSIASTRRRQARHAATRQHFQQLFAQLAKANDGRDGQRQRARTIRIIPAGGCRMGADPATSVVDSYGRTHDHENLFVVGSPTLPTGGCTNGTLTFVALALRSAARSRRARPRVAPDDSKLEPRRG